MSVCAEAETEVERRSPHLRAHMQSDFPARKQESKSWMFVRGQWHNLQLEVQMHDQDPSQSVGADQARGPVGTSQPRGCLSDIGVCRM